MQVDLDALEAKLVDKLHGPTCDELYRAAPSLIAELREARNRIAELAEALAATRKLIKPFASSVYNDNGDMTVTNQPSAGYEFCCDAYFAERGAAALLDKPAETKP